MVKLLLVCYDLLLYTADFMALLTFMDTQYGKIKLSQLRKNSLLFATSILSGLLLWNSPFGGTYIFFSVFFSTVFLPFYPKNKQKKILFSSIQFVIANYLSLLVIAVIRIFQINLNYIGMNYVLLLGGMHTCFWLLIFALGKISGNNGITLPNQLFMVVLASPAASFVVLIFFYIRINNNPDVLFFLEVPLILTFIFINSITAFIYSKFCSLLKKTTEVLLLQQQISLSEQYLQNLTDAQDRIKGIRHDMKNHLQSLMLMSKQISPQTKETRTIQGYLQKLLSDIHEAAPIVSTGNMGIDAILSLKITQIRELKIALDSNIAIPAKIHLSIEDSIIILGNILDNAIKACKENPAEKRWLRLEVRYIPRSLFIRLTNPISDQTQPVSPDDSDHGFGLKNVRTAIKKYNGAMEIENNETFTVKIMLYNL